MTECHVLIGNLAMTAFFSLHSLIGSIATDNYSFIDRLWSILPVLYTLWVSQEMSDFFQFKDPLQMWLKYPKMFVMLLLPLLWGIRLTYNFARKGGYSLEGEDYRWAWMRKNTPLRNPIIFQLFNIFFISTYQTLILQLITHPIYLVFRVLSNDPEHSIGKFSSFDGVLTVAFLTLLLIEYLADEQQWEFYTLRQHYINNRSSDKTLKNKFWVNRVWSAEDFKAGFNDKLLFRFSRHPNFIAEFSMWFVYATFAYEYLFISSIHNTNQIYPTIDVILSQFLHPVTSLSSLSMNIAGCINFFTHPLSLYLGAILLWLIFMGSVPLTEHISVSKYPLYEEYQKDTPRLVPNPITVMEGLTHVVHSTRLAIFSFLFSCNNNQEDSQ